MFFSFEEMKELRMCSVCCERWWWKNHRVLINISIYHIFDMSWVKIPASYCSLLGLFLWLNLHLELQLLTVRSIWKGFQLWITLSLCHGSYLSDAPSHPLTCLHVCSSLDALSQKSILYASGPPRCFWWKIHLTNQLISWIMMNHEYQTSIADIELFQLVLMNNCPTVGIFSWESKNLLTRESRFRSFLTESWLGCTDPSKDISWSPFLNPGCFHEGDWEAQEDAGL